MTPRRIAMWSGPRNISTALMRSWENRPDTAVVDEPLYAHYLLQTGMPHPGADEVIRSQETDWRKVVEQLTTGDIPGGKTIYYQKHMTHHLLPEIGREWLDRLDNVFLLRDAARGRAVVHREGGRAAAGGHRPAAAGGAVRVGAVGAPAASRR